MLELYDLTENYHQLLEMAEDPSIDAQTIEDTMEGIQGDIEIKVDSYITSVKALEPLIAMCKEEEKRIAAKRLRLERIRDSYRNAITEAVTTVDGQKLKTEHYRASIVKNGGETPIRVVGDVPAQFCKREPDMKLIRDAMNEGIALDFAEWGERGTHLAIK